MSLAHSLSASDLAKVVGIDERTVRKLEAKKVLRRDPLGGFDLADNVQAYLAHREGVIAAQHGQGAYGKARAALTLERARVMRLKREELEGLLAPLTEMRTVMQAIFSVVRNRVMAIGSNGAALGHAAKRCCSTGDR